MQLKYAVFQMQKYVILSKYSKDMGPISGRETHILFTPELTSTLSVFVSEVHTCKGVLKLVQLSIHFDAKSK